MEVLVVAILIVVFWILRRSLSVERPGKMQHLEMSVAGIDHAAFLDEAHCAGAHGLSEADKAKLKEIAAPAPPPAPKP